MHALIVYNCRLFLFRGEDLADLLRLKDGLEREKREMQNLNAKIGVQIKPVFQSKKISQVLSPKEKKPPIVNNSEALE